MMTNHLCCLIPSPHDSTGHYMATYAQDNMGTCWKLPHTLTLHSLYMPSCVNRTYCTACAENHLLCSQAHADAPLHPRTWHCMLSLIRHAKVCARMQRVGATGQGQGHDGACVLVLGEHAAVGVGRRTGQQRGVRCVTCSTNEFPWPGKKTVGRAY